MAEKLVQKLPDLPVQNLERKLVKLLAPKLAEMLAKRLVLNMLHSVFVKSPRRK